MTALPTQRPDCDPTFDGSRAGVAGLGNSLTAAERRLAESILAGLREEAAERVVGALGDQLSAGSWLPGEICRALKQDAAAVIRPVLDQAAEETAEEDLADIARRAAPALVLERLVALGAAALTTVLCQPGGAASGRVTELARATHERAMAQILALPVSSREAKGLSRRLARSGRLTPSLILRTLALGGRLAA